MENMPHNKIHMLYNGQSDEQFRSWLKDKGVIVHEHNPTWTEEIEKMRSNGKIEASHLFQHSGNYFGTWQRIDVPLLLDTEYCLLLDADTVVSRPFTMADFGLNLTRGLAMSSEYSHDDQPVNAGVMVMNIPFLRETYSQFLEFILQHVDTATFNHPSPSDQGAYLEFYWDDTKHLAEAFNHKPYWNDDENTLEPPFIIHFHGPKPHDYLKALMGQECAVSLQELCSEVPNYTFLCPALRAFAKANKELGTLSYCRAAFGVDGEIDFCNKMLSSLAEGDDSDCLQQQKNMRIQRTAYLLEAIVPETSTADEESAHLTEA
jgi:hypothetical protein